MVKVKIPENLNIIALLQTAKIELQPHLVDKIAFLCHEVHLSTVYHRDYLNEEDRPYFPLYSKILQAYFYDYASVEKMLIDKLKVIECNGKYSKRHHVSFGFRFSDKYYGQKMIEHEITSTTIYNKIQKFLKADPLPDSGTQQRSSFLKRFWRSGKLRIDVDAAMQWIDATYQSEINRLNCYYTGKVNAKELTQQKADSDKEKGIRKLTEKCEIWRTSVDNFNTERLVFRVDDFSMRLHTKLTNLKKELRGFITYNGDSLVSLDIKNSQPYLSLALFNEGFWRERSKESQKNLTYRKIGVDKINKEQINKLLYTIMLAKTSKSQAGQGFEFDHFCSLVTSGHLYEFLIELFKEIRPNAYLRSEVKKQFLIYLYYNPADLDKFSDGYATLNLLKEVFPSISELFLLLKKPNNYQFSFHPLTVEESFKFPPQLLQRIESHIVIDMVCKGLNKGNKGIPLFTIHDSIVTTKKYEHIVLEKLETELSNAIGYKPEISVEDFVPLPAIIKTAFAAREITELTDELIELLSYW